ncbi:cytosine deaminase [Ferroacidibacillus organovorans]|uniref:cytosine deaminase n=1 Tax=Ferroacidibacillus organovorans TaxID=1765683 RepID=UPI0011785BFB|nr:cytosine deaminase [Ferroacidibacillus organovorans]
MDTIVRNVRLLGRSGHFDVGIERGTFTQIAETIQAHSREVIDGAGQLMLPPFIESHIHLDSVLTAGQPRFNESGTLFEGIQVWSLRKQTLTREDVKLRAHEALRWQMAQGILHVRTHVDVTDPKLTALQALLEVKEEVAQQINLQIVAFPQEGIPSFAGGAELLEEALRLGADVVGAIPHFEYTRELGVASLHTCFELAEKYDRMVDVHCDEIDDEQSRFLETVAYLALLHGLKSRVTASHATAMHSYNGAYVAKLMRLLKRSEINIVANPLINITLQGRFDHYPTRRGVTRIKELWREGVNVSLGHDDILDPWYALGTGSMLQVAHMAVHASHMTGREEIDETVRMVSTRAARTLGVECEYGIAADKPASFVLLDAEDAFDMIRRQPPCTLVVSRGNVVARTSPASSHIVQDGQERPVTFARPFATREGNVAQP